MKLTSFAIVASLAVAVGSLPAATIAWNFTEIVNTGGAQDNMGTGFLASDGTLVVAENSGGAAITFDGIAFAAGSFSLGGTSPNAFHSSDPILDSATYGTNGTTSPSADGTDISLGDDSGAGAGTLTDIPVTLTVGQTYRLQLVLADGRGNQAGRSVEIDGNATDHALGVSGSTWGNSLLATGTFVADDTFQLLNINLINNGSPRGDGQINAFALHNTTPAVPEPSSALLALVGLAFGLR
ncbi:MAG: hypothetical protein ACN4GG_10950, partial [Akkermansiaceae bacterium]